jgi:hypothetical protein
MVNNARDMFATLTFYTNGSNAAFIAVACATEANTTRVCVGDEARARVQDGDRSRGALAPATNTVVTKLAMDRLAAKPLERGQRINHE